MKIETIEIGLVLIIVIIQIIYFVRTYNQILSFKNIIPHVSTLGIRKVFVPADYLNMFSTTDILERVAGKNTNTDVTPVENDIHDLHGAIIPEEPEVGEVELSIIEALESKDSVFAKILFSINKYLVRNRDGAYDFNLIKDIVERNVTSVEEDINSSIGIPLYLGLMGTILGIVIGLFNMPDLSDLAELSLNVGISTLIDGVKYAMIASFFGLTFTVVNSGWKFKSAKRFNDVCKNDFYTFIQVELLPSINQGLAASLGILQMNLLKFNDEFSGNIKSLTAIFDSSRSAIREQKELLEALDKAKVSEMTRYNLKVLQQLDVSVKHFEKFNAYLGNVTQLVDNSQSIVQKTSQFLARTEDFKRIAENLQTNLDMSLSLTMFLSSHFKELEGHKEFTRNAVADIGHSISETFRELKQHIEKSSDVVKEFTVNETELLKNALSESKTNLGNLEHLAALKSDLSALRVSSVSNGERLMRSLDDMNSNITRSISLLEQIRENSHSRRTRKNSLSNRAKNFGLTIKSLFNAK